MSKQQCVLVLRYSIAWWFRPYLWCVAAVSAISGREPDWHKVSNVALRALSATVVNLEHTDTVPPTHE